MTRNRRPGAGTNAPTSATTPAGVSTTTACAGAFFVGPSFHALRVRSVLSLVLVRVCPVLRCVVGSVRLSLRGYGEGTYQDNIHVCVCGLCAAGLGCGCVGGGRYAHARV